MMIYLGSKFRSKDGQEGSRSESLVQSSGSMVRGKVARSITFLLLLLFLSLSLSLSLQVFLSTCSLSSTRAHAQQKDMEFTNDRFEHLVYVFRQEIHAEHEREHLLLKTTEKKALRHLLGQVWIKRYEAVDRIVDTIEAYGLASGLG